jgi:TldD protein
VTIVDESLDGDNAYQPFSGNGVPRRRVEILKRGVLTEALADVHTADRAGTPVTGAARQSSFASVPIPRMSNIRIEVVDPFPVPEGKGFFDWKPEEVRDLLVASGDLAPEGRVAFLSGYRGGQVNPALGEFVFHSTALYELTTDAVRLFKPGIFSGRIEAALHSITRGFGPLRLDAAGTCGKAGQGVPSSGGSHHFLLIAENPQVGIGGRA